MRSKELKRTKEQWLDQAIEEYEAGKYKSALAACKCAIQIDSTYARAFHGEGLILEKLGRYPEALSSFRRASQLASNKAKIHLDLANLLYKLEDYADAKKSYDKAVQIDKKYRGIYQKQLVSLVAKAQEQQRLGSHDATISAYKNVLLFDPSNGLANSVLAELLKASQPAPKVGSIKTYQYNSRQTINAFDNNQWQLSSAIHPANCRCKDCYEF